MAGEELSEFENGIQLARRGSNGCTQFGFRRGELFLVFVELCLRQMRAEGIEPCHRRDQAARFLDAASHDAGRLDVVIEQVVHRNGVRGVKPHGSFESFARLLRMRCRGEREGRCGALPPGAAQPGLNHGIGRRERGGLFERVRGFLEIPQLVVTLAEKFEALRVRFALLESRDRIGVIGRPVEFPRALSRVPGKGKRAQQRNENGSPHPFSFLPGACGRTGETLRELRSRR